MRCKPQRPRNGLSLEQQYANGFAYASRFVNDAEQKYSTNEF